MRIKNLRRKLFAFFVKYAFLSSCMGLFAFGACLLAVGCLWRTIEDGTWTAKTQLTQTYNLELQRLQAEHERAKIDLEQKGHEYETRARLNQEEFANQRERLQLAYERKTNELNAQLQAFTNAIQHDYDRAQSRLNADRVRASLALEEARLQLQRSFDEAYRRLDLETRRAARNYESEAARIAYVRQELEILLNDIQREIEPMERAVLASSDPQTKKQAGRESGGHPNQTERLSKGLPRTYEFATSQARPT